LILRHQLTVLQRRQPRRTKLNWADRALLATLFSTIPKARRHGLRLLVTPDTILRWHRNIVRRRQAARSGRGKHRPAGDPPEHPGAGPAASPGQPLMGLPQDPRRTGRPGSKDSGVDGMETVKKAGIDSAPRRTAPTWSQFLRSQAEAVLASDFFTADLLDGTQAYVLAVPSSGTRLICGGSCASTRSTTISTGRTALCAAPRR
jgi:putative transposase